MFIELRRPNGYDFQIRDGAHLTDTTPIFSEERAPTWGHYSFEIGFMFKQNAANPGFFDTGYFGTINATGADPCANLSAPHTRSLAYYSTAASNYCSDAYALGTWTASHGQTFVATGNRIELEPANSKYEPIVVNADAQFRILGVVRGVIRTVG